MSRKTKFLISFFTFLFCKIYGLRSVFQSCPQKVGRGSYWAANENFYCSITALLHWFLCLQIVSFKLQNTICKYRNIFDSVFLLNTTCIYIYALYFLLYIDCGLFRPFHTSAVRSIAVGSFFTAKAKALCCYGKFTILSEVKLSEGKGHFTHTSSVQSIAVGSFFTAKTKAAVWWQKHRYPQSEIIQNCKKCDPSQI